MTEVIKQNQLDRDKAALINPVSAQQVMDIGQRSARLVQAYKNMKGYEEQHYLAFENMIEAYHIMGEELAKIADTWGGDRRSDDFQISDGNLKALHITGKQAHEWRNIALVPRVDIEAYVKSRREEGEPVTKVAILEMARNYKSAAAVTVEEVSKLTPKLMTFCIQAKDLTDHLRKYPETRTAIPKEFFDHVKMLEGIIDSLNRAIL